MDSEKPDPMVDDLMHDHVVAAVRRYLVVGLVAMILGALTAVYGAYLQHQQAGSAVEYKLPLQLIVVGGAAAGMGGLLVALGFIRALLWRRRRRLQGPPIPVAEVRRR